MEKHTPVFNEEKLRDEIAGKWGAYGAHSEVYADLLAEREKLKAANAELVAALERIAKTAAKFDSPDTRFYVKVARAALARAKE